MSIEPSITCSCGFMANQGGSAANQMAYDEHNCPNARWFDSVLAKGAATALVILALGFVCVGMGVGR